MTDAYIPPSGHASDCEWHIDQYPWECTCGFVKRKAIMDGLIADSAALIDEVELNRKRDFDDY